VSIPGFCGGWRATRASPTYINDESAHSFFFNHEIGEHPHPKEVAMKRHALSPSIVAFVLASVVVVAPALGALPRTFVAPDGNDANPCSLAQPCRTLQVAVYAVAAGGDVVVLGSAGYGSLVISKSVSIIAPTGVYAGIAVTSGDAILATGDHVALRGLTITGNGGRGIYASGSVLHVENCVISGFGDGILASSTQSFIKDSFLRGNDTGISVGLSATTSASIDHVRAESNGIGIRTDAGSTTTVRNSVASGNTETGFFAFTGNGTQAVLNLENCMASNNATGIEERFSIALISNCIFTGNTTVGVTALGGFVYSRGNNTVFNNGTNVTATITPWPAD
jgi:parallel beta helix pectate lyase-like protein